MAPVLLCILWLVHILSPVSGFTFSIGQAGECDPLSLLWSGGLSPFQLLIIPPGGTMANISIPASAYNNGQGSYTLPQLKLREEQQFMLSMSDATGIFAGGTSSLLSVGASQGGQKCNTTFPVPDFTFSLDSSLAQCSPFPVTLYSGPVTPVLPVRLLVNIPQGHSFVVGLPLDLSSWIANLTAGTAAAFTVIDARSKNGGTEMLRVTKATNNTSCLVSSATTASASPTGTTTPQQTHKNTTALAVGISIGGFGLLCIALIFFWYHRRRQLHALRPRSFLDLSGAPPDAASSYYTNAASKIRARQMSESSGGLSRPIRPGSARTAESQGATSVSVYTPRTAGHHPSDIVIHRDITETTSPQAIEFPPEYSASFPPIPGALLRDLTNGQHRV
ncbi:hypothetical protein JOM56_005990 [Amanita muscaria]